MTSVPLQPVGNSKPAPAAPAPTPTPVSAEITSAFLPPAGIIKAVETAGVNKANTPLVKQFLLGCLAGAYIAVGGCVGITVGKGMPSMDPGIQKFAFAAVFPVGLVIVIICGSELITGNFACLIPGLLNRKIKWYQLLLSWLVVYIGNFVGSIFLAYFFTFLPGLFESDPWLSGAQGIAEAKVSKTFGALFFSAMGCNWLVCLAVFMALAGKTLTCKVLVIWFPIQTFVTCGYEHCVANMYLIPVGMLYGANVTFGEFIGKNLVPVTLGNIVSAVLFVGTMYWYLYGITRPAPAAAPPPAASPEPQKPNSPSPTTALNSIDIPSSVTVDSPASEERRRRKRRSRSRSKSPSSSSEEENRARHHKRRRHRNTVEV